MEKGAEREKSLMKQDYLTAGYFSQRQWNSFCFQSGAVYKLIQEGNILEIGQGAGIVGGVLRSVGFNVESLDINENLRPTWIGDISSTNFSLDKKYDCVICAEVLEHIPFDKFNTCLENIQKLSNKYVIITLPNCEYHNKFMVQINNHHIGLKFGKRYAPIAAMHFWELNSNSNCTNNEVRKKISHFFKIIEEGEIFNNEYHYYYILEITSSI